MATAKQKAAAKARAAADAAKKSKSTSKSSSSYKNTAAYKALSSDGKKMADLHYEVESGTSKYNAQQLKDALKQAKKDSSGYMKQIIREFETTTSQQLAQETGDYQSHLDTVNENIKEINQDLATNKDFLSLEEQRTLAQSAKDYEQMRGNIITQIQNTGTTFSSIGEEKKTYAEQTQQGFVESTTAKYDKQVADLETQASRGNLQAKQQLADLKRTHEASIQNIGTKAETYLGTKGLSGISGLDLYKPLGDISGQIKEDTVKDIASRQQTYYDQSKQASLNFA
ncbi:MAG: hypothetical protein NTW30_06120 [Candidatus Aenigmarchaeota archaeon]|nr:hypothetical protein [Candidatus Aenigmarchaeota archaeon]